jgi:hypothetical protein
MADIMIVRSVWSKRRSVWSKRSDLKLDNLRIRRTLTKITGMNYDTVGAWIQRENDCVYQINKWNSCLITNKDQ